MINLKLLRQRWDAINSNANRLDPNDEHDWHSLLLGLIMGIFPNTDPLDANDAAEFLYYNEECWTTEALIKDQMNAMERAGLGSLDDKE